MHQQQRHHRRVRVRPLAMTNIRQRKADPSPSSRGTMYPQEEMIRIVIAQEDDHHNDRVECDDLDLHSYHYTPQPSRMIPDKRYKDYLQGQRSKRKDVSSCPTGPECACHCITFSWIAVAFLVSCPCLVFFWSTRRRVRLRSFTRASFVLGNNKCYRIFL